MCIPRFSSIVLAICKKLCGFSLLYVPLLSLFFYYNLSVEEPRPSIFPGMDCAVHHVPLSSVFPANWQLDPEMGQTMAQSPWQGNRRHVKAGCVSSGNS